jgi:acetoin:2,6-dichlorophenolindophenol oxidoreductase subunit beta
MGRTVAEVIRETTREHLARNRGLFFGQCVSAVGWIGGTVPQMSEAEGIVELSLADVTNAGIVVGAALVGRRPIYTVRYQGFMWYNAASIVNYAAKSKEIWGVPCPIFLRAIAMEGNGIGPVASASQHGLIMRMPGMPICAPMSPNEWTAAWKWFMRHDDPLYVSEHRKSFAIDYEFENSMESGADITLFPISAARLNAIEAAKALRQEGIKCNIVHLVWLKPFTVTDEALQNLSKTKLGLVIDSDFEIGGPSRSIAYDLMHKSGAPVFALGLEDRTAGVTESLDNPTPTPEKICRVVRDLVRSASRSGACIEP